MKKTMLIKSSYLKEYIKKQSVPLVKHVNALKEIPFNRETTKHFLSEGSAFSSMIEGNNINFDEYLEYSSTGTNTDSKSFLEIEDLIAAYKHAGNSDLNINNFLKAHSILARTLLPDAMYHGKVRDKEVHVFGGGVKIYTGASPALVKEETDKLFNDIHTLLNRKMTISEVFYFASMIHLVLLKIHPFVDGNGRSSRLLEKWFIAQKSGKFAWFIPSEKLYHAKHKTYYKNMNVGEDYSSINYDLSLPFLLLLPLALKVKK